MGSSWRGKDERIDWLAARDRLAQAQAATETALDLPAERARAVMDERARALAQPLREKTTAGPVLEILILMLGRERYAIETRFVREVMRLVDLTPVPGAPAFVLGITNLRGEILAVVDLRKFFAVADQELTHLSRVIVLGEAGNEFGILADAVQAVERLGAQEVLEPPESVAGIERDYLRGTTRTALMIIDGGALLGDARLLVDQRKNLSASRLEDTAS